MGSGSKKIEYDISKVNRLEVINHATNDYSVGRVLVMYAKPGQFEFSFQDDGKTLKIFVGDI